MALKKSGISKRLFYMFNLLFVELVFLSPLFILSLLSPLIPAAIFFAANRLMRKNLKIDICVEIAVSLVFWTFIVRLVGRIPPREPAGSFYFAYMGDGFQLLIEKCFFLTAMCFIIMEVLYITRYALKHPDRHSKGFWRCFIESIKYP